jgi:hypothetical protein
MVGPLATRATRARGSMAHGGGRDATAGPRLLVARCGWHTCLFWGRARCWLLPHAVVTVSDPDMQRHPSQRNPTPLGSFVYICVSFLSTALLRHAGEASVETVRDHIHIKRQTRPGGLTLVRVQPSVGTRVPGICLVSSESRSNLSTH